VIALAHLALIVRDLRAAERVYARCLGLTAADRVTAIQEGVRMAFIPVGRARLELLEPIEPQGALARFLESRGEGIHHLAFEVTDLDAALVRARRAGFRPTGEAPRPGAHGTRVAFLHPQSTHGVLMELVERLPSNNCP